VAIEVFNRYETKYIISDNIYHSIKPLLEEYMEVDAHSRNGDFYNICNIYYDTEDHAIIRRSIEKPVYKEKLRLRSYGVVSTQDKVYLEIKKKYNGRVNKRRTGIRLEEAYRYVETKVKPEIRPYMKPQVISEIEYMLRRYPLQPSLFLSYDRNAMFGIEDSNFRITFDTNIITRRYDLGLEFGIYGDSLLPQGLWIMEAKTDNALPLWFAKLLSRYGIYQASFSKYGTEYQLNILHNGMEHHKSVYKQICI
jgi:SPX domain protein involved in polyphosphate accumulation